MLLKKLFLASASVLMLALAYHLGASTATAQAGIQLWDVDNTTAALMVGRQITYMDSTPGGNHPGVGTLPPVPGGAEVVTFHANAPYADFVRAEAITADGDVYWLDSNQTGTQWQLVGNLSAGTVPARTQSWGSVKVQQR